MINVSTHGVSKHGSHDQQSHAGGKGRAAGAPGMSSNTRADGKPLTTSEDKKLSDLSVEMFNHRQTVPMSVRTGKLKTPAAQAFIQRGQQIVSQAQEVYGGSREETMSELNRRIGS